MNTISSFIEFVKAIFQKYEEPIGYIREFEKAINPNILDLDLVSTSIIACNLGDVDLSLQRLKEVNKVEENVELSLNEKNEFLKSYLRILGDQFDPLMDVALEKYLNKKE